MSTLTHITTTTGRVLEQGKDYNFATDMVVWLRWATTAYWYAVGTSKIAHKADTDEYRRMNRCMNGMPTDTDIVTLQEWAKHIPADAQDVAHRAWMGK